MSVTREVTVWCDGTMADGSRCTAWTYGAGAGGPWATVSSARWGASEEGWLRTPDGRDLCPNPAHPSNLRPPQAGGIVAAQRTTKEGQ